MRHHLPVLFKYDQKDKTCPMNHNCGCSAFKSFPTLCDPVDCSTPGFPVLQGGTHAYRAKGTLIHEGQRGGMQRSLVRLLRGKILERKGDLSHSCVHNLRGRSWLGRGDQESKPEGAL